MMGVVVNQGNKLSEPEKDVPKLKDTHIFKGMLTCHSLTIIDEELAGDPLDVKVSAAFYCSQDKLRDSRFAYKPQSLLDISFLVLLPRFLYL